jgi:hypothetical protein
MTDGGFGSITLIVLQVLIVLSVVVTFLFVVKLPTIKHKTKAAYIGVTANAVLITAFFILKYLIL